jgi:hypothetical protein
MGVNQDVVERQESVDSGSYRHLASRGSHWHVPGFNEKRLMYRIDGRILPVLFTVYFLQLIDKIILNYANVMGLQKDLKMHGSEFSWAGTAFFIGYGLAEFPQGTCGVSR